MGGANNKSVKVKLRSRSYPRYKLQGCVEFLKEIREKCGTDNIHPNVLREAMQVAKRSATFDAKLSASKQFGLIETAEGRLNFSTTAKNILYPVSENAEKDALIACFKTPKLYKELIERYSGVVIPPSLPNILFNDFKIIHSAKDDAATIFLESGKFVGLIDQDNRLIKDEQSIKDKEDSKQVEHDWETTDAKTNDQQGKEGKPPERQVPPSIASHDFQEIKIDLTEDKQAIIFLPRRMSLDDIELLKFQIDFFELQTKKLSKKEGAEK